MSWIKKLFGVLDRTDPALDRIGAAVEGLADDLEMFRERVRTRLGLDEEEPPVLPDTAATTATMATKRSKRIS